MRPDVLHGVDLGVGDLRELESVDHLRASQRLEGVHDDLAQRNPLGHLFEVGREARVLGEFGLLQHLSQADPFALVLQAQHHRGAIAGGNGHKGNRRVAGSGARRRRSSSNA